MQEFFSERKEVNYFAKKIFFDKLSNLPWNAE